MKYSPSTKGFYTEEVHGSNIPTDAVEITKEYYDEIYSGHINGKVISSDATGKPILIDHIPTTEELINIQRSTRDMLLIELDAIISNPLRWNSFSDKTKSAYSAYRQSLLDVPQQQGFPNNINWPTL